MSKRKWSYFLVGGGLLILLTFGVASLFSFSYTSFTIFCMNQRTKPRELPIKLIRPIFWQITKIELPEKADGLRAVFFPGRPPEIFIKFRTDSDGIGYILQRFGGPGSDLEPYDKDKIEYMKQMGLGIFNRESLYQKELVLHICDPNSIKSGWTLYNRKMIGEDAAYAIFVDDQNNTVYVNVSFFN